MPKSQPRVIVTRENDSGRNTNFKDTDTGRYMNRAQFVKSIEHGSYEDYHVRVINGVPTPVSNPDNAANNNLG